MLHSSQSTLSFTSTPIGVSSDWIFFDEEPSVVLLLLSPSLNLEWEALNTSGVVISTSVKESVGGWSFGAIFPFEAFHGCDLNDNGALTDLESPCTRRFSISMSEANCKACSTNISLSLIFLVLWDLPLKEEPILYLLGMGESPKQ